MKANISSRISIYLFFIIAFLHTPAKGQSPAEWSAYKSQHGIAANVVYNDWVGGLNSQAATSGFARRGYVNNGAAAAPAPLTKEQQAQELNEMGNAAYAQKDWFKAATCYLQALGYVSYDPTYLKNYAYAMSLQGIDAYKAGDTDRADECFRIAVMSAREDDNYNKTHLIGEDIFKLALERDALSKRKDAAHDLNSSGIMAFNKNDYASALAYFKQALEQDPDDKRIQDNVAIAQARVTEEQNHKNSVASAQKINGIVQDISFDATPSGGLDPSSFSASGAKPDSSTVILEGSGPAVIPKPVNDAITQAFRGSPPDAVDRIRKGMQAVMLHDWKVANAWFGDALNHDPGNPQLKAFVETFQDAMQNPKAGGFPTGEKPKAGTEPTYTDAELRAFTTGTDAGWRERARANVKLLDDALDSEH